MPAIYIGTRQSLPDLQRNLDKEFSRVKENGVLIDIEPHQLGRYAFIACVLSDAQEKDGKRPEETLRTTVSSIVSTLLLGDVSKDFVYRMTRIDHPYLSKEEAWLLCDQVISSLNESGAERRLARVQKEVEDFLRENDRIFLEGFLRFRLKDYFFELKERLEELIDNFLADKEYQEFIKLLQYFVEIQEPRIDEVHVLFFSPEEFFLLDEEKKPLEQKYLRQVLGEEKGEELKHKDLLLSALITLAPQRLFLHHSGSPEEAETLVNIFKERVIFCRDCDICRRFKKPGSGGPKEV
jgi:putative sporulation protein YtxC